MKKQSFDPKQVLQLTRGKVPHRALDVVEGRCNPAVRHGLSPDSDQPLLHRNESAMCQSFNVDDGFACTYLYGDNTFSIHRQDFNGSLIDSDQVLATGVWSISLAEDQGEWLTDGLITTLGEEGLLRSAIRTTTYVSLRVLGVYDEDKALPKPPSGSSTRIVRIPGYYAGPESCYFTHFCGPQLIFRVLGSNGPELEIDPDFTWRFPDADWDQMRKVYVEMVVEVHQAFFDPDRFPQA